MMRTEYDTPMPTISAPLPSAPATPLDNIVHQAKPQVKVMPAEPGSR
jgi:hypothetical protein